MNTLPIDEQQLAYATNQLLQQLIKRTAGLRIMLSGRISNGGPSKEGLLACSMHNFMQWIEPTLKQDPAFALYDLRISEPRGQNNAYLSQFSLCGAHVRVANSRIQADLDLDRLQNGTGTTYPEWLGSLVRVGVQDYQRNIHCEITWHLTAPTEHGGDTNLPDPFWIECNNAKEYLNWVVQTKLSL
jgi:hypothetical protein